MLPREADNGHRMVHITCSHMAITAAKIFGHCPRTQGSFADLAVLRHGSPLALSISIMPLPKRTVGESSSSVRKHGVSSCGMIPAPRNFSPLFPELQLKKSTFLQMVSGLHIPRFRMVHFGAAAWTAASDCSSRIPHGEQLFLAGHLMENRSYSAQISRVNLGNSPSFRLRAVRFRNYCRRTAIYLILCGQAMADK